MNLFHRVFIVELVFLTLFLSPVVNGQKRTREELLKEAGRIITEAERANGEAMKKAEAARDRQITRDAQKFTAGSTTFPSFIAAVAVPDSTNPTCSTSQNSVPAIGPTCSDHFHPECGIL